MSERLIVNKGIVLLIRKDDMVAQGHPYRLCSLSESCLGLKVNDSRLNLILEILSFKNKRAVPFLFWQSGKIVNLALILMLFEK